MIAPNAAKLASDAIDPATTARLGSENFDRFFIAGP